MDWNRDWHTITINETNVTFIVSIVNESNGNFLFNLSDFKVFWRERINWQEILCRAKSENPFMNVDGEEETIGKTINSLADNYNYSSNENELRLKLKYYITGLPFHFHWQLTKCSSDVFYEEITKKLLVTLLNVEDQKNELTEIVKRKDVEINQYKLEGANLLRKHVATQPFVKQEFERKFELINGSGLFELASCNIIKNKCNYKNLSKVDDAKVNTNALKMQEGTSPTKISKSNKEQEALRKFQTKKEKKIKYENSCELLIADDIGDEMDSIESAIVESTKDQTKVATKRKFKSKLNL